MSDKFSYSIRKKRGIPILDLCGKINGSLASTLLREELVRLRQSGASNILLNFLNVTSIDSLGVMAITDEFVTGMSIKIIHLSALCNQMLEKNRAGRTIPVYGSEEEAMGSLARPDKDFKEMRMHNRINTNIPVEILINHNRQRGILLNISEGGALVGYVDPITSEPYTINLLNIMMELPLVGSIAIEGKPVRFDRTSEMYLMGIRILSSEDSQNIVKQVYKDPSLSSNPPP